MAEKRQTTEEVTEALIALPGGPGAVAHLADHLAAAQAANLAVRTTALNAAATVTAGMSEAEVLEDHDSREHDPLAPVSDVIALAGEFEEWLGRPQTEDEQLETLRAASDSWEAEGGQ